MYRFGDVYLFFFLYGVFIDYYFVYKLYYMYVV